MSLVDRPLFTDEYDNLEGFLPEPGSTYIFGVTSEQRSEFAVDLRRRAPKTRFVELRETDRFVIETDLDDFSRIPLRRRSVVEAFMRSLGEGPLYLDMTGLGHSAWAPLTKVCLDFGSVVRVVYLEPSSYARNASPHLAEVYDLSERIEGIEPMPLFASLDDAPEARICFVPLLGFEGTRFAHMLEEVQPLPRKTIPIIGVPGFQPDYPFNAFLGNASAIERANAQRQIHFAKSNCPFSLFYTLDDITNRHSGEHFKIGLVGTKPHALGATLFALRSGKSVELIYDHVKRKKNRTSGIDRCLVYGVSDFLMAAPTRVSA
jgi:hypothetical protein